MNFSKMMVAPAFLKQALNQLTGEGTPLMALKRQGDENSLLAIVVDMKDPDLRASDILNFIDESMDKSVQVLPDFLKKKYNRAQLFEQQLVAWNALSGDLGKPLENLIDAAGVTLEEWNWLQETGEVEWLHVVADDVISEYLCNKFSGVNNGD